MWLVLLLACGTVERGRRCQRHSDCLDRDARCVVWLTPDGEGRRTCEIPCTRVGDCPAGESCAPQSDSGLETCQ